MAETADEFYARIGKPVPKWIKTMQKIDDPVKRAEFLVKHYQKRWYHDELTSTNQFILKASKRDYDRAVAQLKKLQETLAWQEKEKDND